MRPGAQSQNSSLLGGHGRILLPLEPKGSRSKNVWRKSIAKCTRNFFLTLLLALIFIQLWAVFRIANKSSMRNSAEHVSDATSATQHVPKIDYIMWSKDEAYMRDCELHYKGNVTWGKLHAPYVDKIEAKNIVKNMDVPFLRIIPTLAVLDMQNITTVYTLQFLKSLKQPYIIKSTHLSGGVARVHNNKFHCFKYCMQNDVLPLGPAAVRISKMQWVEDLKLDYSINGRELQYRYITPRIIIEEDIISGGKTDMDVTFWWLSNGHPLFVSQQCEQPTGNQQGFEMARVFVGTDYRLLPIVFNRATCKESLPKPKSWNAQLRIAKELGKEFPGEVVRIDLYGGGEKVWFSEFTFTTAGCWRRFTPAVTDGLLYGLMKGSISPNVVTPLSVENMLNDDSWVLVTLDEKTSLRYAHSYPSPVDLCMTFEEFSDNKFLKKAMFERCIRKLKPIQKSSLRCMVSTKNGTVMHSFGINVRGKGVSNSKVCAARHKKMNG